MDLRLPSLEPNLVNERKFVGCGRLHSRVASLLDARCIPDREHPEGRVNSVYFDSPDLASYFEKRNGDNLKRKLRIRWYGRREELGATIPVFVELKFRIGSARRKLRRIAEVDAALVAGAPLSDPFFPSFVASLGDVEGMPLPTGWIPTCCVSYDRLRWDDPLGGSRVALDRNIHAVRVNPVLFPGAGPVSLDELVCEFKNPGGAPPAWAEEAAAAGLHLRSFSKYGELVRRLVGGGVFS